MKSSSNWSTAITAPAPGARRGARSSARSGCSPGRSSASAQRSLPGQHAGAQRRAAARPAAPTTCRCPTGRRSPSSGAPASRATISATSRSRPKNTPASSTSKRGEALERAARRRSAAPARRARAAACSSTTPPARSSSAARRSERSLGRAVGGARRAAARPRRAPTRAAARWTRRGDAAARLEQPLDRDLGVVGAYCARDRARRRRRRAGRARSVAPPRRPPGPRRSRATSTRRLEAQPVAVAAARSSVVDARAASGGAPRARAIARRARVAGPGRRAPCAPSRCTSAASSAASRVLPIPAAPVTSEPAPAPARARRQCSRSQSSSASRPASGVPRVELGRQLERLRRRQLQRRVLAQDRLVQLAELWPGSTPRSLDERPARVAVGLQRVGLAAGAVEREHPLRRAAARVAGARAISASSSGDDRVVLAPARVRSNRRSTAASRSSSRRPISGGANGSLATSSSGGPRHSASAPRAPRRPAGVPGRELPAPVLGEGLEAAASSASGRARSS